MNFDQQRPLTVSAQQVSLEGDSLQSTTGQRGQQQQDRGVCGIETLLKNHIQTACDLVVSVGNSFSLKL